MKDMHRVSNFNLEHDDLSKKAWRYLDFSKFIALLESRSLYFSPVSRFEDCYEGVYNCLNEVDFYGIDFNDNSGNPTLMPFDRLQYSNNPIAIENSTNIKATYTRLQNSCIQATGVNCWHLGDNESHAMWKVFLKSNEGVAIQTTVKDLMEAIYPTEYSVKIGKIKYIDYQNDKIDLFGKPNFWFTEPFFRKNLYFSHEKELRLVINKTKHFGKIGKSVDIFDFCDNVIVPLPEDGVQLPVDVDRILKNLYISPYAPKWFNDIVQMVCKRWFVRRICG